MSQATSIKTLDINNLPVMVYQDEPVCTTEMLAQFYGTQPKALRDNFSYQKARFVEGKHYITIEGAPLKEFKSCAGNSGSPFSPSKFATKVSLWTERGAARHAKMLDTDQAWEVFEALEDSYFQRRAGNSHAPAEPILPATLTPEQYEVERERLEDRQAQLAATPIAILPEHYEQLTGARIRVGKKTWLVNDLIGELEALGISREVAEHLTGHSRNTIRQHAFIARKRKGGAA